MPRRYPFGNGSGESVPDGRSARRDTCMRYRHVAVLYSHLFRATKPLPGSTVTERRSARALPAMSTSYSWSYAPTNRASCKGKCKEKIEKGAIRLGSAGEGAGDYTMVSYRCLGCVTARQFANMEAKVGPVETMDGFDALSAEDQDRIKAAAANMAPAHPPAAKKATASPAAASSSATPASSAAPEPAVPTAPVVSTSPAVHAASAAPFAPAVPAAPAAPAASASSSTAAQPAVVAVPPHLTQQQLHAFSDAAKKRDFNAVQALLDAEPGYVNAQPSGRWSALHQFAQAGNVEAVKYLVRRVVSNSVAASQPSRTAPHRFASPLAAAGQGCEPSCQEQGWEDGARGGARQVLVAPGRQPLPRRAACVPRRVQGLGLRPSEGHD